MVEAARSRHATVYELAVFPLNDAASRRYIYRMEGTCSPHHSVSVEVRDNGETNATMRLRAIEIEYRPTGSPGAQLFADQLLEPAP